MGFDELSVKIDHDTHATNDDYDQEKAVYSDGKTEDFDDGQTIDAKSEEAPSSEVEDDQMIDDDDHSEDMSKEVPTVKLNAVEYGDSERSYQQTDGSQNSNTVFLRQKHVDSIDDYNLAYDDYGDATGNQRDVYLETKDYNLNAGIQKGNNAVDSHQILDTNENGNDK